MSFLYSLFYSKLHPPLDPVQSFADRTVLVTGANCGLGFEAALKFVSLGAATVILGCRDFSKGERARLLIEERTRREGVVRVMQVDMSSYQSMRSFVNQLKAEIAGKTLDVALLNAGIVQPDFTVSEEGWEETLQVNLLGTTFLGILLLPILKGTGTSPLVQKHGREKHLCFVSSGNYASAAVPSEALGSPNLLKYFNNKEQFQGPVPQYNVSKLFLMYAANELAASAGTLSEQDEKRETSAVVVNSVNPGATATALVRNIRGILLQILAYIYLNLLARTAEQGSRSLVSACTQGWKSHGGLWQDDRLMV